MPNENAEHGSRQIGACLPTTLRSGSPKGLHGSWSTQRRQSSVTIGSPSLARAPQNSIGQLLGETGYGTATYPNQPDEALQILALIRRAGELKRQPQPSKDCLADVGWHLENLVLGARPDQIIARIDALLEHFYSPNLTDDARGILLLDWGRLLSEFPLWAIDYSCLKYLRKGGRKRPMPADIIEGINYEVERAREAAAHCRELAA